MKNFNSLLGKKITDIKIGDTAYFAKTISESDVNMYAGVTGDVNPMIVDEEFAKKTKYGRRIAHGMLIASFFSNIVGTKLPGPGTMHKSYKVRFLKPVFIGDSIETKVEVVQVCTDTNTVEVQVECINQDGEKVLEGQGLVFPPANQEE